MILVYTGDGKGKTSACVGQAVRAMGQGLSVVAWAQVQLEQVDMLVLDETLYALSAGILEQQELEQIIALARASNRHLVLSGRNAPHWLVESADLVTSMTEIKHPWRTGVKAAPGIEF